MKLDYFAFRWSVVAIMGWWGQSAAMPRPEMFIESIPLTPGDHAAQFTHLNSIDVVWTNTAPSGDWNVAENWNPNIVPNSPGDNVTIPGTVTITIDSDIECGSMTLGGSGMTPTLTGSGTLRLYQPSVWSSGSMTGTGRTIVMPGAFMLVNAPAVTLSGGRTLENRGDIRWTGETIFLSGSVISNAPGGSFDAQNAGAFSPLTGGTPGRFDNAGLFRKSFAGTTSFGSQAAFNNFGDVQIKLGTLLLGNGGAVRGAFHINVGTTLEFAGGTFMGAPTAQVSGDGHLRFSGGTANLPGAVNVRGHHTFASGTANLTGSYNCTNNTVMISGGAANFSSTGVIAPTNLTLSGGTLRGSSVVTVRKQMTWSGGSMTGSGRTYIPPEATLVIHPGTSVSLLNGRTLDNAGTVTWGGTGTFFTSDFVITNRPGSLFEIQSAAPLHPVSGALPGRFDNAGILRKTAAGTTTFGSVAAFNNFNLVEVLDGTLVLGGGGNNHGAVQFSGGRTLEFSGGTFTSMPDAVIEGRANLVVSGGTAHLGGLVHLGSNHTFSGGSAHITGDYTCTDNTLTISNSLVNFDGTGTVAPDYFFMRSGTLGGTRTVSVRSHLAWSGGTMTGPGRTHILPGGTLAAAGGLTLMGGRILDNAGTTTFSSGSLSVSDAVVTNRPGALMEISFLMMQNLSNGIPGRLDNAGVLHKLPAGAFSSAAALNNYGQMNISGMLLLLGGGANWGKIQFNANHSTGLNLPSGTFHNAPGAEIGGPGELIFQGATAHLDGHIYASGPHSFAGGTVNIIGHYTATNSRMNISGGVFNFNGTGTIAPQELNLGGGTLGGSSDITVQSRMTWTSGTMSGTGRTIIAPTATLTITPPPSVSVMLADGRTLDIAGTGDWLSSGTILVNGIVIINRPGAAFNVRSTGTFAAVSGSGPNRFDNAGTFRKLASSGTTTFNGLLFRNFNRLELHNGTLAANGGFTPMESSVLHYSITGTNVGTGYGRLQVDGTVGLAGKLALDFAGGFHPPEGSAFTLLTAGTRGGAFSSFDYPSDVVTMQLSNTATSVIVHVTRPASEAPVLLTPQVLGCDVRLVWTATSNRTYRVEFAPDPGSTNWTALSGDVTTASNTASRLDTLTASNRFYRVRPVP